MELSDSINGVSFQSWLSEVKTSMFDHPDHYSTETIKYVDHELDYWQQYFQEGMTPTEAVLEDLNNKEEE